MLTLLLTAVVLLPGLMLMRYLQQGGTTRWPTMTTSTPPDESDLGAAIDRLVKEIDPDRRENGNVPVYARAKLRWVMRDYRAKTLPILLVNGPPPLNDQHDAMMTSTSAPAILVYKPRFVELLQEGSDGEKAPFTAEQRNDFMLGIVHQAVHLEYATRLGDAATPDGLRASGEERRVWRELTLISYGHFA